jgi:nucleoside-diphosphate-sugar epimerase
MEGSVVCITGVSGFLGQSLAAHFNARGHQVRGCTHRECPTRRYGVVDDCWQHRLGDGCSSVRFENVRAVIHCAHDFSTGASRRNTEGTALLRRAAAEAGVATQIFLSSVSARPDAVSEYGKVKYAIEQEFLAAGLVVVRPGLVVGPGGLFASNLATLLKAPLVPLPDGGRGPCPVVDLRNFVAALEVLEQRRAAGAFNLFIDPSPTLRQFLVALMQTVHRHRPLVAFPAGWAAFCAAGIRACRLPVPLAIERLETMRLNSRSCPHRSDITTLLDAVSSLTDMLAWAWDEIARGASNRAR